MSIDVQEPQNLSEKVQTFRVDVQLHDLLKKPQAIRPSAPPPGTDVSEKLPDPLFPQRPELLTEAWLPEDHHGSPVNPYKRHWTATQVFHAMQGWMFPYFKSRLLPGDFHPIIVHLFTEWKCNLDCQRRSDGTVLAPWFDVRRAMS